MDWAKVERRLSRAFSATPRRYDGAVVVQRRHALALPPLIEDALSEDERQSYGGPDDLLEIVRSHGIGESLLNFYWEAFGPMCSEAVLGIIGVGERRYLCYWDELESYRLLAAVEPWDDRVALSAAVSSFLSSNGRDHGTHAFASLPLEILNRRPDLVPEHVVRQSLFDYMQWCERVDPGSWAMFASEHYGRMVEPNHALRSLDVLQELASMTNDAYGRWRDDLAKESAAMPDHARQRLLDEWFETAYEEA
jgi:hypothetical protein